MSQVPYLRGLRGLGMSTAQTVAVAAKEKARLNAEFASRRASAGRSSPGPVDAPEPTPDLTAAQEEVDRTNEQAADLFTRGGDTTNLTFGPMATRPGRVSPLSVSWNMPLQVQPIQSRTAAPRGISGMSLGLAAGVVVVVGASLYLIFKD